MSLLISTNDDAHLGEKLPNRGGGGSGRGIAPYCASFLRAIRVRLWQRGLRFISGTMRLARPALLRHCRFAIRRSDSPTSRPVPFHPFLIERSLARAVSLSLFFLRVFVSPRDRV